MKLSALTLSIWTMLDALAIGLYPFHFSVIIWADVPKRQSREILYTHGIHMPDLSILFQLYRYYRFLFLVIIVTTYLFFFNPVKDELVLIYSTPSIAYLPLDSIDYLTLCMNRRAVFSVSP